jgi:PglZ domain
VPLGLVAGLPADARDSAAGETAQVAREALIRLEPRLGGVAPATTILRSWAAESSAVIGEMLRDPVNRTNAVALLARADELLVSAHGAAVADRSDLLPAGLTGRLAALADALRAASARAAPGKPADPDAPQIPAAVLTDVEQAWARVAAHRLADADDRTPAFHAAVRLARWLAADSVATGTSLRHLLGRHRDNDAWADSAVNDTAPGVSDPNLGAGLAAVLATVRIRRAAHDLAFAAALAAHTDGDPDVVPRGDNGVRHLEDLLPDVVLPLARSTPVLLLVLDGMSAGVAAEVLTSVLSRTGDGWAEALLSGHTRRAAALAVLPTVTEVSRASLLCGQLRTGGRDVEERGYQALARAHGLAGAALFHKKPLDSSRLGHAVADDVAAAIGDVTGHPLVTCVLNTIDDALDRSDPVGTEWGAEAVKHLLPLLDRARHAGRVVILTADHGFVAERRQGTQRAYTTISSGRSRAAIEPAAGDEVLVTGRRVLLPEGQAVLAVDEQLRYGPLKAGYHGGAAPAEAVVPVAVLVPGAVPEDVDLRLAPPQEPAWWIDPVGPLTHDMAPTPAIVSAGRPEAAADLRARHKDEPPTLFDESESAPTPPHKAPSTDPVAAAVLKSPAYAAQKKIAGRVSTTDGQIRGLLATLLAAPGHRLQPTLAATALDVSPVTLRGAVLHAQRLLNVEGYPVLRVDADGSTVILDEALLREQFGISS